MRHAVRWACLIYVLAASPIRSAAGDVACKDVESIGVATMDESGTITLRLRSLPPGPIGEGILTYSRQSKDYAAILRHLGGLVVGQSKFVRPWCP